MASSLYEKIMKRIGKLVEVRTIDDRIIVGTLSSFNPEDGSIMLEDAYEKGKHIPSVYINGSVISQINFFEYEDEEKRAEEKVGSLINVNPNLTIAEIAEILDLPKEKVEKIVLKLRGRSE